MIRLLPRKRYTPIGIDIGARAIKLVQFHADRERLFETARVDFPARGGDELEGAQRTDRLIEALKGVRDNKTFRGRDVVICLGHRELFLQNIRVPKVEGADMEQFVQQEAAGRIPFPVSETQIRFFDAADVRQGDVAMREVILMAAHQPVIEEAIEVVTGSGLRPVSVDVEPAALLRSYTQQFRRGDDKQKRALFVHIGYSKTVVVIAQGDDVLFIKYVNLGGKHFDEAVASHLDMDLNDAASLRKHNGDRRRGRQDPEVTASVNEGVRSMIEKLSGELAKCIRYHSVTFRGRPIVRLVLGGGEATPQLVEEFGKRLDLKCELSDPFRSQNDGTGRPGQWDIAAGLSLREFE